MRMAGFFTGASEGAARGRVVFLEYASLLKEKSGSQRPLLNRAVPSLQCADFHKYCGSSVCS